MFNNQPFPFRTLYITLLYSRHNIFSLCLIINVSLRITLWTHKLWHLITPSIESIINYNYIFHNPTSYYSKQYSTQQPNLHHYYFTTVIHILFNSISSSNLPLISLESCSEATADPSSNIPTDIHSSHHVPSPILTPRNIPTDDTSIVLPTQLYTSVYFIISIMPHMSYMSLCFPTHIMTQAHAPTHSP